MKTFLAIIGGYVIVSAFIAATDWLAKYAGNIVGPITLIGMAIFAGWLFRQIVRNYPR
jgi:uncharacterized membrane protein